MHLVKVVPAVSLVGRCSYRSLGATSRRTKFGKKERMWEGVGSGLDSVVPPREKELGVGSGLLWGCSPL